MKTTANKFCAAFATFALLAGAATASPLVFTPYHASGHYSVGEMPGWTVTLAPGAETPKGSYSFTVVANGKIDLERGSFDLKSGSAKIEIPPGHEGSLRVTVDYMAPLPPPPPSPVEMKAINAAMRVLVLKSDPSLKDVLDKYPNYQFVHRSFDFRMFQEDRAAILNATVTP